MVARTGLFVAPLPGSTPAGTAPTDGRLVLGGLFGTAGGCMSGGGLTTSSTTMQITVASGVWKIPDPSNSAAVYISPIDGATLTLSAGPASGSRIDALYIRQNNYEAGDADSRVNYGVVTGTAAATPTAPAVPAGAMRIANVTVPTNAANSAACTILQFFPTAVMPPEVVASTVAALQQITGTVAGQQGFVGTSEYRWNGTAWMLWAVPPTAYTPTLSGITLGNGTLLGVYWVESGVWHCKMQLTFGSSTALTTSSAGVSSPGSIAAAGTVSYVHGSGQFRQNSAANNWPLIVMNLLTSSGLVKWLLTTVPGSGNNTLSSSTQPFTPASGDVLSGEWTFTTS